MDILKKNLDSLRIRKNLEILLESNGYSPENNNPNEYIIVVNKSHFLFNFKDYISDLDLMKYLMNKNERFAIKVDIKEITIDFDDFFYSFSNENINKIYDIIEKSIIKESQAIIWYYLSAKDKIKKLAINRDTNKYHLQQVVENCIFSKDASILHKYKIMQKLHKKMFKFKLENDNVKRDKTEGNKPYYFISYDIKNDTFHMYEGLFPNNYDIRDNNLLILFTSKEVCEDCVDYLIDYMEDNIDFSVFKNK